MRPDIGSFLSLNFGPCQQIAVNQTIETIRPVKCAMPDLLAKAAVFHRGEHLIFSSRRRHREPMAHTCVLKAADKALPTWKSNHVTPNI